MKACLSERAEETDSRIRPRSLSNLWIRKHDFVAVLETISVFVTLQKKESNCPVLSFDISVNLLGSPTFADSDLLIVKASCHFYLAVRHSFLVIRYSDAARRDDTCRWVARFYLCGYSPIRNVKNVASGLASGEWKAPRAQTELDRGLDAFWGEGPGNPEI